VPVSEDKLQVLLPRKLKRSLVEAARRRGVSTGEYVRRLIDADLHHTVKAPVARFPFGEAPVRTGRRKGSVDHDRPG